MSINTNIVTRFAPSPTGYLHLGGARTALFNWLYARQNEGKFILRIEDTDVARSTDESVDGIIQSMNWLGMDWDEGPYFQSQRLEIYQSKLEELVNSGHIYPAFETKEELELMRAKAIAEKRNPIYDRASLRLSQDEIETRIEAGDTFAWRFKVPDEGYTIIPELLMGGDEAHIQNKTIGDFILTRPGTKNSPGMPLYNFVCTVDDAAMGITHVIRGVEHFTNAARQVLIYDALNAPIPEFVHLPVITKNGKKMSKRDVDLDGRHPVSVMERKELGYLPDATINHVALLGWSHPGKKEIIDVAELKKSFSLAGLNKSNSNFDEEKYLFFNSHYLTQKNDQEILDLARPFFIKAGINLASYEQNLLVKMVAMEKTRCKLLADFPAALSYFFDAPQSFDSKGVSKDFLRTDHSSVAILERAKECITSLPCFDAETITQGLAKAVEEAKIPFKVFGPVLRLALTGRTKSPSLGEVIEVLGPVETNKRFSYAQNFISSLSLDTHKDLVPRDRKPEPEGP